MKSEGALRVVKNLKAAWPLLYGIIIIPKPVRDYIYMLISKNRFKWFGKRAYCYLPEDFVFEKFL